MNGSLTIVGLGPARPEHLTLEAAEILRRPPSPTVRAYGLAHVRELCARLAPHLDVRPIDYLYALPGVDRPVAYNDLAQMLLRRAFEDGFDVLYLVAGSPLVLNDAVLVLRRACADRGLPLRIVHGMSFVELILDRVFWTGHQGLQVLSTWNIARDGMVPATDAPLLLAQLGEYTQAGSALDTAGSTGMLAEIRDRLLAWYPPAHPVTVLYSSGTPDYRSLARCVSLDSLAAEPVPVYSNLWVPSLTGPPQERDVAPPTDGFARTGDAGTTGHTEESAP